MKAHARLSPSAAHRWLRCTASPTLEAQYEATTSEYAEEGTFAHSLAELYTSNALGLISKRSYTAKLNKMKKNDFFNQEMADAADEYAMYIKERLLKVQESCPDAFAELEVKLDLTDFIPEGFGTADCIIIAEPEMYVIDFKYGKGVKVEAEGNPQMEIYALGALAKYGALYDIQKINMTIIQPRLGGISEFRMDTGALRAWASIHIIPFAKEAYEGPGRFCPGEETCRFCRAKQDCKARADYYVSLFDDSPDADFLTPDEAGKILQEAAGMKEWLKDLEDKVTSCLFQGMPVAGWKLVAGRSNRTITDEDTVVRILKTEADLTEDQIWTKKLAGITQYEKLLGKKTFNELLGDYVVKPEGKPTLAPADDKRPEIFPAEQVVNAFDE
jgi:hypothetical protein